MADKKYPCNVGNLNIVYNHFANNQQGLSKESFLQIAQHMNLQQYPSKNQFVKMVKNTTNINIQPSDLNQSINTSNYILWTSTDIAAYIQSIIPSQYHKYKNKLKKSLINDKINGHNITQITKHEIHIKWGIKIFKTRKLIYNKLQKLKDIKINFESWNTQNIVKWIKNIVSNDTYDRIKQEITEQEIEGTDLIDFDKEDIELLGVDDENEKHKIFNAIQELIHHRNRPYCCQKETLIDDCLVLFLGIKEYFNKQLNIFDIRNDYEYFDNAFNKEYKYKYIANDYTKKWTVDDVDNYLNNGRNELINAQNKNIQFNGLIVCIAAHGSDNHILCSDGNKIDLKSIRNKFSSDNNASFVNLPKVFVFNSCRMDNDDDDQKQINHRINKKDKKLIGLEYSTTILGAPEGGKVYGSKLSRHVADAFQESDDHSSFQQICKTIKQKFKAIRLGEHDVDMSQVKFTRKTLR